MDGADENRSIGGSSKVFRFYDDFDNYGSPPNAEDGGFLPFSYQIVPQEPRISTFDRINQELSKGLEEQRSRDPVTLDTPVTPLTEPSTPSSAGISISISEHGLVLNSALISDKVPEITIRTSPVTEVAPQIILPLHVKGPSSKETNIEAEVETGNQKTVIGSTTYKKVSLVEKIQMVSAKLTENSTPYSTPSSTPYSTPLSTPQTSPKSQRRSLGTSSDAHFGTGVVMEKPKSSVNSYFYKGTFFSSVTNINDASSSSLSSVPENTKKMQEAANVAKDLDNPTRKRRPKPSTLREMNLWAPTSM